MSQICVIWPSRFISMKSSLLVVTFVVIASAARLHRRNALHNYGAGDRHSLSSTTQHAVDSLVMSNYHLHFARELNEAQDLSGHSKTIESADSDLAWEVVLTDNHPQQASHDVC